MKSFNSKFNEIKSLFSYSFASVLWPFVTILSVPFIVAVKGTEFYGEISTLQDFAVLLGSLMLLSSDKSLYKLKDNYSEILLISNIVIISFICLLISSLILIFSPAKLYLILFAVSVSVKGLFRVVTHTSLSHKQFLILEIFGSILYVLSILYLVNFTDFSVRVWFLSISAVNIVGCLAVFFQVFKRFKLKLFSFTIIKDILSYSFPLLLFTLLSWIINFSDRIILRELNEPELLGIRSISKKISMGFKLLITGVELYLLKYILETKIVSGQKALTNILEHKYFKITLISLLSVSCLSFLLNIFITSQYVILSDFATYNIGNLLSLCYFSISTYFLKNRENINQVYLYIISFIIYAFLVFSLNTFTNKFHVLSYLGFGTTLLFYIRWINKKIKINFNYLYFIIISSIFLLMLDLFNYF
jgi:O-antigen/teichoic acid export membrane protein